MPLYTRNVSPNLSELRNIKREKNTSFCSLNPASDDLLNLGKNLGKTLQDHARLAKSCSITKKISCLDLGQRNKRKLPTEECFWAKLGLRGKILWAPVETAINVGTGKISNPGIRSCAKLHNSRTGDPFRTLGCTNPELESRSARLFAQLQNWSRVPHA